MKERIYLRFGSLPLFPLSERFFWVLSPLRLTEKMPNAINNIGMSQTG